MKRGKKIEMVRKRMDYKIKKQLRATKKERVILERE